MLELQFRVSIPEIAKNSCSPGDIFVSKKEELPEYPRTSESIPSSLNKDLQNLPNHLRAISSHYRQRVLNIITELTPHPADPAVLLVPGYLGPVDYLKPFRESFPQIPTYYHPYFTRFRPIGNLDHDAELYCNLLKQREAPSIALAHSRGGPTIIKTLIKLQRENLDHLLHALILIAPVTNGVRREVAQILRRLPVKTFRELCPGHPNLPDTRQLSPENAAKVISINSRFGDSLTSPEGAFFDGSSLILTPQPAGHLNPCLNPQTQIFQTASNLTQTTMTQIAT